MLKINWSRESIYHHLKTGCIAIAFFLTIFSWLEICTSSCAEVHFYKFFGYDFELLGIFFFIALGAAHLLSSTYAWLSPVFTGMTAAAVGSEINFIRVQKYVIGEWCPICLTIAFFVGMLAFLSCLCYFHEAWVKKTLWNKGFLMKTLWNGSFSLIAAILGFSLAFVAVAKPEKTFAEDIAHEGEAFFGNKDSDIDIYIVTDWFCPACKRREPTFRALYPLLKKRAKIYFIDKPIHSETLNFLPYNLSFMVKNKDKYFDIRLAMIRLAERTKRPSLQDIADAVRPLGVFYEPISYSDIDSGRRFFEGISETFNVKRTPTLIIAHQKKLKAKKFMGNDITESNVLRALAELE